METIEQDLNLDERGAAELLGGNVPLSIKTLQSWRLKGGGPPYRKYGRLVRYSKRELLRWMEAQACTSTSETN